MLRHSVRVLPVPALLAGLLGAAALLGLVHLSPALLLQAAGLAAAVVAATASRLFDEPAAAIVDTLPRPLWWRTAARTLPAAVLAGLWVVGATVVDTQGVGRPDVLRLQGVGAIAVAAAACICLRRRGHATPGWAVGSTTLLAVVFLVLVNPVDRALPFFPFGAQGPWAASRWLWTATASLALGVMLAACVEGGRQPAAGSRRPHAVPTSFPRRGRRRA